MGLVDNRYFPYEKRHVVHGTVLAENKFLFNSGFNYSRGLVCVINLVSTCGRLSYLTKKLETLHR